MKEKFTISLLSGILTSLRLKECAITALMLFILTIPGLAQTPTVSSLTATGTDIKWYLNATGGAALDPSTPLVNGQHYYASQTVNGCESSTRLEVVANLVTQASPGEGVHVPSQTQIVWNWTAVAGATGYRIHFINHYNSAVFMYSNLTVTEPGLNCNTAYTRYVWAVNAMGCISQPTVITQTTSPCVSLPSVSTGSAGSVGSTTATLNGNITSTGGVDCTVRGFKYSTTSGFDPAVSGTNVSETGTYGTGTYALNVTGLTSSTTYYVRAYAVNSAGYAYGSEVSFSTIVYTVWNFTNASASGRSGPTQAQVNTAYSGTSLEGGVTVSVQGVQQWTVPVTGVYRVEAYGAGGGANYYTQRVRGGYGAKISGEVSLTAGQVLKIVVGQRGIDGIEDNYATATYPQGAGGSGGGGSFVTYSNNSPLMVAGGGGGTTTRVSYAGQIGGDGLTSTSGGNATGACAGPGGTGGAGGVGSCNPGYQGGSGGGGITGTGGSTGGNTALYGPISTGGTSFIGGAAGGIGGTGASVGNCRDGGFGGGGAGGYDGGGGGGYSGGGGGGDESSGGGGSYNGGSNQSNSAAFNINHGYVVITKL